MVRVVTSMWFGARSSGLSSPITCFQPSSLGAPPADYIARVGGMGTLRTRPRRRPRTPLHQSVQASFVFVSVSRVASTHASAPRSASPRSLSRRSSLLYARPRPTSPDPLYPPQPRDVGGFEAARPSAVGSPGGSRERGRGFRRGACSSARRSESVRPAQPHVTPKRLTTARRRGHGRVSWDIANQGEGSGRTAYALQPLQGSPYGWRPGKKLLTASPGASSKPKLFFFSLFFSCCRDARAGVS